MCCKLIGKGDLEEINGLSFSSAPGNCKSKNVIYLVICKICHKPYIDRTVQLIHNRITGHRDCFYSVLDGKSVDEASDDYSLGLHLLHEDGVVDNLLSFYIVEKCSPATLVHT